MRSGQPRGCAAPSPRPPYPSPAARHATSPLCSFSTAHRISTAAALPWHVPLTSTARAGVFFAKDLGRWGLKPRGAPFFGFLSVGRLGERVSRELRWRSRFGCAVWQHQNTGGTLIHHGSTLVHLCGATFTLMATTAQTLMTLCGVATSAPTR